MSDEDNSLVKALHWVMDFDPATVIADAEKKRTAHSTMDARALSHAFVESYSKRAAVEGFVLGLPTNPFVMAPSALGDMAYVLRLYAFLTAAIGYLANPKYFEDPDWKDDALLMLAGPKAVSRLMREAGVQFGMQGSKTLIRKYLSKSVLTALKRFVLRWFGKKVTQRMLITKIVPVVGGVIGGTWNYFELRVVGGRIIKYHFDGTFA